MAETIWLDPAAVAGTRVPIDITRHVADDGPDWGDAEITQYLAESQQGSIPIDYIVPSRTVVIPLILKTVGTLTFEAIRQSVQAKVALFQREGGWISRTTSGGTFYAEVTGATLKYGGDWFQANRSFDANALLTLICRPDFYGAEVQLDDIVETANPEIATTLKAAGVNATIRGNYPARARIVVDDDQGANQRGLVWSFRCRHYSSLVTARSWYNAETLTPLDAAVVAGVTGASGTSGANVIRHPSLALGWTPVLSTMIQTGSAHMTHVGSYQVWARCYTTSTTAIRLRLAWDVGDLVSPVFNAPVVLPGGSNFYMVNLGQIRLDAAPVGAHRWQGAIQAYGAAGGENVAVDRVWVVDVSEAAGTLRASPPTGDVSLTGYAARDEFNQTAGALTGKTMPVGGAWAGAGSATDFTVFTATTAAGIVGYRAGSIGRTSLDTQQGVPLSTNPSLMSTGRFALAGSATFTNVIVSVDFSAAGNLNGLHGVLVRYTDINNYLVAGFHRDGILLIKNIAGTEAVVASTSSGQFGADAAGRTQSPNVAKFALSVFANGNWAAYVDDVAHATGNDPALATGGALATGRIGVAEVSASTLAKSYDNFAATVPVSDAVIFASQSAELRHDGMIREDSTGSSYGPVSRVTGSLPRVPPSGPENRPVELFLKASRGDLAGEPDSAIDDISARVLYRPCWLLVPGT